MKAVLAIALAMGMFATSFSAKAEEDFCGKREKLGTVYHFKRTVSGDTQIARLKIHGLTPFIGESKVKETLISAVNETVKPKDAKAASDAIAYFNTISLKVGTIVKIEQNSSKTEVTIDGKLKTLASIVGKELIPFIIKKIQDKNDNPGGGKVSCSDKSFDVN